VRVVGIAQAERTAEFRRHLALDPMQARQLRGLELRIFISALRRGISGTFRS
jgi:hypothetical protein